MRLPLRARLTAWYAVLLGATVAAIGAFVVLDLRAELEARIDDEVRKSSVQIAKGYAAAGARDFRDVSRTMLSREGSSSQVLTASGRILVSYGDVVAARPIAPPDAIADALGGRSRVLTVHVGRRRHPFRVVVSPVRRLGRTRVLVVAESLQDIEESVRELLLLLLLAGPAGLAATAGAGWWLARRALLPVERMTSKAAEIGIDRLHERIDVPQTSDEIGHLAVTLNAMLERLEQGVREKHRLIADASHELRTPLAVMRSEIDVSLRQDELSPAARAVLESAREEVDDMSRTVGNLLTLAQVDEGRLELLKSHVSLREAIESAAGPLRPLAAAKGVALELDGGSCRAQADPHRLHQVLTNLIENAIKFAPPGGEVAVTAWRAGDEVGVTVRDDGPGIPAEARPHIFDRFYRVDRARGRDVRGSGLGLAICREIALAHGGRVWVDTEDGNGSAFSLALPRQRDGDA